MTRPKIYVMKKMFLALWVIVVLTVVALVATGRLTLSDLKSSALNTDTCSPAYIREKAEAYHQAAFDQQENMNQIAAIKAELLKLEAQKSVASEADIESITANITAQETALETLEAMEVDELIAEYEACKQNLLFKWLISGEAVVSGEIKTLSTEVTL